MKTLTLREMQLEELNLLANFDSFCRKYNLKYSLVCGTLLGAVRHKGFIPWDDDVDVAMPRPDYERFIQLFNENRGEFPPSFDLTPDKGENALYPFLKLVDRDIHIELRSGELVDSLWIDIFPLDGYPSDDKELKKMQKKARWIRRIFSYSYMSFKSRKGIVRKLFHIYGRIYGGKRAFKKLIEFANRHAYEESEYIGDVVWGLYGFGERLVKTEFEKLIEIEFEGHSFLAMSCWDSYLSGIYGDYMQPPPENKRGSQHGITATKKEPNSVPESANGTD